MLHTKVITMKKKMHSILQKYQNNNEDISILEEEVAEKKYNDFEHLANLDIEEIEESSAAKVEECKLFIEIRMHNDVLLKKFTRLEKTEFSVWWKIVMKQYLILP